MKHQIGSQMQHQFYRMLIGNQIEIRRQSQIEILRQSQMSN